MIDLFKNNLVAINALADVALNVIKAAQRFREGFPQVALPSPFDADNRPTTGYPVEVMNLVFGVVRKQRIVPIFTTGRQRPVTRQEHPMIRVTDNAHKEIGHLIVMGDAIEALAIDRYEFAFNIRCWRIQLAITQCYVVLQHG